MRSSWDAWEFTSGSGYNARSRLPSSDTSSHGTRSKGTDMRAIWFSALLAILSPGPQEKAAEIRVISPGVVYNAGLLDLAAAYTRETGTKVTVTSSGMGK